MKTDEKHALGLKINEAHEKFCFRFDAYCTGCPYIKYDEPCEILFTLSYLNKRKKLKE